MRKSSREPVLADAARWLGEPQQPEDSPEWDGLADVIADLSDEARTRFYLQTMYMRQVGVRFTREIVERMITEAAQWAEGRERRAAASSLRAYTAATVYYLRVGQLIKIGQTVNLSRRLTAYPPDSTLLAFEIGPIDQLEAQRHEQFASGRINAYRREWFHPSAELIQHINSLRDQPLTPAELTA